MNPRALRLITTAAVTAFVAVGMSGCFLGDNQNQDAGYDAGGRVHALVAEHRVHCDGPPAGPAGSRGTVPVSGA